MKQRVVVQAIVTKGDEVLLLRRSQGRPGIVGKYELPGGTLSENEQPDDGVRRHLKNDAGIVADDIELQDALSMTNREDGDIQHIFIVYGVVASNQDESLILGQSYDQYEWKKLSDLHQNELRDSAQYLLDVSSRDSVMSSQEIIHVHNVENISTNDTVTIYSDGGSRGNPGPSAAAFVVRGSNGQDLGHGGVYLGITTNNQAEYHGVRLGLEYALEQGMLSVDFKVDSMLVVNQLKGMYHIKNRELWPIHERIRLLMSQFTHISFTHIPREQNHAADNLVNKLLDDHRDAV